MKTGRRKPPCFFFLLHLLCRCFVSKCPFTIRYAFCSRIVNRVPYRYKLCHNNDGIFKRLNKQSPNCAPRCHVFPLKTKVGKHWKEYSECYIVPKCRIIKSYSPIYLHGKAPPFKNIIPYFFCLIKRFVCILRNRQYFPLLWL